MLIESLNPATGEIIGQVESTAVNQIGRIVSEARIAQSEWNAMPLNSRGQLLRKFGETLLSRRKIVAELISRENGKPVVEAYTSEIIPALDFVKYYTAGSRKILRRRGVRIGIPLLKTKKAFVRFEPVGVVGIISPWNYPLMLPLGQIVPALMAGDAVIFKPSEFTPLVGGLIGDFMWEAGIPKKLFSVVQGGAEVGAALVSSGLDKLFFTGSTATGRKVSEGAAKALTPVSLELGSKDAMIVLSDADVDSAASGAIWGAFMNAGQTCVSVERCFIDEKISGKFIEVLKKKAAALKTGAGTETGTDVGAIIHKAQYDIIRRHISDATSKGARVITGAEFSEEGGRYFIRPTILADVPMDCLLMKEETFGPVLPIVEFKNEREAVELANASKFGLSASIWTADPKRGLELAGKVRAGAVTVNDVISYYGISDGIVGGVKESGTGRVHGREGLLEMVSPKYYEVERTPRMKKLWWYKYDALLLSFFETATDFLFFKNIFRKAGSLFKLAPKILRIRKS